MRRDATTLLDQRLRLHRGCAYDPAGPALWVRRKNPIERLIAYIAHRGEARVRLELDERSDRAVSALAAAGPMTGRELATRLGVEADGSAVARRDADLAALLVFLSTLRRAGVLVTEPI